MKDITIKITGNQFIGDEMEERMEFVTDGRMYERNGANYYIYEESEFSGFPGCMTSLKLKDGILRMKRLGKTAVRATERSLSFAKVADSAADIRLLSAPLTWRFSPTAWKPA